MGLPKPLGPYQVSFQEFELRRMEGAHLGGLGRQNGVQNGVLNDDRKGKSGAITLPAAQGAPLIRIFYPTTANTRWSLLDVKTRSWVPNLMYVYGFVSKAVAPTSALRRFLLWILSCLLYPSLYPYVPTQASVKKPLLIPESRKDGRLPVVIFSHGMWATRTTYTATCIDVASHGYIVVAPEHLDGSAGIAQYHDYSGKRKWVEHAFADVHFDDVPMTERSKQLRQRVEEIQKTVDVLEALDQGLLSQSSNIMTGRASFDVKFLQGHLDLNHLGIHGHSFGGATAIATCGVDKRFKCCVAEDVWWAPLEEADYKRAAGRLPVLLLNTEKFEWTSLKDSRNKFLAARAQADRGGTPLVTELLTLKGLSHMDQCDFPLLFAGAFKRAGMSGNVDVFLAKDINSRASLDFFYKNLLPPGSGAPYMIDVVKEDGDHIIVGKTSGQYKSRSTG